MRLFWWRDTGGVAVTESAELSLDRDAICHELRNALAGIQYERKQIAKSLITIQTHMARIEAALR
jgi:hypothetical protein